MRWEPSCGRPRQGTRRGPRHGIDPVHAVDPVGNPIPPLGVERPVPDVVECAECGNRYDSDRNPFCPRCGSTRQDQSMAAAMPSAARARPQRRRVQAGGLVLLAMGALLLVAGGAGVFQAEHAVVQEPPALAALPGGEVHVRVLEDGAPRENVSVAVLAWNGSRQQEHATDAGGWANLTMDRALSHVIVADNGTTWNRTVVAMEDVTVRLELDLATADREEEDWLGVGAVVSQVRILGGVLAFLAAMMVAGGVAALRVRARGLAMAGIVAGMVPALLSIAVFLVVGLLIAAPVVVAAWLIVGNRSAFG